MSEALAKIGLDPKTASVILVLMLVFFVTAKISLKNNDVDQHH